MTAQISAGVLAQEAGRESNVPRTERKVASCSSATEQRVRELVSTGMRIARVAQGK